MNKHRFISGFFLGFFLLTTVVVAWKMLDRILDKDRDGYILDMPVLRLLQAGDCDDSNPNIHPDAQEIMGDGIDQDCNSLTDTELSPNYQDVDRDGWTVVQGDCDDSNPNINPDKPELSFDKIDNDCDGKIDEMTNTLSLQKNMITPPTGWNTDEIGAANLRLTGRIEKGMLKVTATAKKGAGSLIGIGLYLYIPLDDFEHLGYVNAYWHSCPTQLAASSPGGVFSEGEQRTLEIPLERIVLAKKDCETKKYETIDLLSAMNQAYELRIPVTIGFYTSSPNLGIIEESELIFDGSEIEVVGQ
ncbi:MAG: putative metal-binding motif-containing protein [Candidatus Peribacteraceae bacterium]|nr:putative metal-binding motif-containing protein [Candidatus Peribacteraceae bacterium]